jgi:hypothetical protein
MLIYIYIYIYLCVCVCVLHSFHSLPTIYKVGDMLLGIFAIFRPSIV